tara:strand:+ start:190 stop:1299 length:1110 start_codon:yes stop_codon:yes gene_type:complete
MAENTENQVNENESSEDSDIKGANASEEKEVSEENKENKENKENDTHVDLDEPIPDPDLDEPPEEQPEATFILKKKKIDAGHGGAHGGAWKIALADMMTAMMAFFLLMWLLGATNDAQRKSIAEYFKPTSHSRVVLSDQPGAAGLQGGFSFTDVDAMPYTGKNTGFVERNSPRSEAGRLAGSGDNQDPEMEKNPDELTQEELQNISETKDEQNFEKLQKEIVQKLKNSPELDDLQNQVKFVREDDGLRVDIIDKADFSMFELGTANMDSKAEELVKKVADSLKSMPNKISITGHTDSLAYDDGVNSNWSLSGQRAEKTRKILQDQGVNIRKFQKIKGVADTKPYIEKNPADPRNRRITITVLYRELKSK